ncbi:hypothetical protein LB515_14710 [Mesorhizobium sp. CA15]|uniref:hypothetical protein n=1 Tax=unclassified Mesorhizobium TaxID=325217 RepID=UPI001CD0646C|nr:MULTISPECIES: hypothetical protein [unclassified Mesorhizobium]MBZ9820622.1 hypothetical protein [Mesorhizobium sp. CA4]MBZ9866631.1 hypothetical protein [Mesorhizobium sp. CA15]
MSAIRKLERDHAKADRAAVVGLLDRITEADVLTRLSLESRLEELDAQIAAEAQAPPETYASAALFFGGRPVVGSRGVEAEFGAGAVATFQDLVAKVLAKNTSGLGLKGPVANKSAAAMHITNIVRGSFGFLLEEVRDQTQLMDTNLKEAVEEASKLLDVFGEADEERFQAAIVEADQRIIATARDFFELLRQHGATLRMVAGEKEFQFGADAVGRGAERASGTSIEEEEVSLNGQLSGVLPGAHQFEFRAVGGEALKGRVDPVWTATDLERWNRELVGVDSTMKASVKRVLRHGQIARENYVLKGLNLSSERGVGA